MIPVNEPKLGGKELEYVTDCIKTGWISSEGKYLTKFEEMWAAYCGMKHGVAVANGSVALELAVRVLDLQRGDEIIMPTFTIISCATAATYNDAVPVLVDSDPMTWCMDVNQVAARITPRTRAIMPVHIYGHPVDMDPLRALARRHDLVIIEDAAEVHGALYKGKRCGGLGDLSTFSFYANKIITTGEGGMVLTNSDAWAEKLRSGRNLGFRKERRFYHTELRHNYRLTNVQAAIGVAQVEQIDHALKHKAWMAQAYAQRLSRHTCLQLPAQVGDVTNVYWMYGMVLDESVGLDAAAFAAKLAEKGVMTRPFFLGMHEQPVLKARYRWNERFPVAERLARQGFYLPSGLTVTQDQVDEVCDGVDAVLRGLGMT